MKEKYMTIEELSQKITETLKTQNTTDKRFSNVVTVRRIRDYLSKGVIDRPIKSGRGSYFTQYHFDQLLKVREMQVNGITENNIKKISKFNTMSDNDKLRMDAFAAINSVASNSVSAMALNSGNVGANLMCGSSSVFRGDNKLMNLCDPNITFKKNVDSYTVGKVWQEIPVDENGEVFLKILNGFSISNDESEKILKKVKQILNIGE